MNYRSLSYLVAVLLASVFTYAADIPAETAGGVVTSILNFASDMFTPLFNPSADGTGLAVFLKFLLIIIFFVLFYQGSLRILKTWKQAMVVGLCLALAAGLPVPLSLIIASFSIYSAIIIATIICVPFVILGFITYKAPEKAGLEGSSWVYGGLALMWFIYFVILTYFLSYWHVLGDIYRSVFIVAIILATLSPIIILVLLVVAFDKEGDQPKRPGIIELYKKYNTGQVKKMTGEVNQKLNSAQAAITKASTETRIERIHDHINTAREALRQARNNIRAVAIQATKLSAEDITDAAKRMQINNATVLSGELDNLYRDLGDILQMDNPTTIHAYITTNRLITNIDSFKTSISEVNALTAALHKNKP